MFISYMLIGSDLNILRIQKSFFLLFLRYCHFFFVGEHFGVFFSCQNAGKAGDV